MDVRRPYAPPPRRALIILAALAAALVATYAAAAEPLSLGDALNMALTRSLTADAAALERAQGKQARAEGVAAALPDMSAAYSTRARSMDAWHDNWGFGFSLRQPVVDAGVVFSIIRGAREYEYFNAEATRKLATLILDVQNGYYGMARNQALVTSAEAQSRRSAENVRLVTRRYELGEANLADKLRADADFLAKEADLLTARNGVQADRRSLRNLIGASDEEITAVVELPPPDEPKALIATAVAAALTDENPDLVVVGAQTRASAAAYLAAWGDLLPALSFTLDYSESSSGVGASTNAGTHATYYGLSLSFPVVDVVDRVLGVSGARLDREQARLELAQAELDARERLESLVADQDLNYRKWESAVKTLELNEEVHRLTARRYELGDASFDELLQVQAELAQAERTLVEAKADYWSSRAELNYVLGTYAEKR